MLKTLDQSIEEFEAKLAEGKDAVPLGCEVIGRLQEHFNLSPDTNQLRTNNFALREAGMLIERYGSEVIEFSIGVSVEDLP